MCKATLCQRWRCGGADTLTKNGTQRAQNHTNAYNGVRVRSLAAADKQRSFVSWSTVAGRCAHHVAMETIHSAGARVYFPTVCWKDQPMLNWTLAHFITLVVLLSNFQTPASDLEHDHLLQNENPPLTSPLDQVIRGSAIGVGQIFVCEALGPSLLIVGALLVYSPLLVLHALLGSGVGALAGGCSSVCL